MAKRSAAMPSFPAPASPAGRRTLAVTGEQRLGPLIEPVRESGSSDCYLVAYPQVERRPARAVRGPLGAVAQDPGSTR